jgi:hypothetical protein
LSQDQYELEQFNAHQMDNRNRIDSLAKSIFLLSGGALTLSIGIFLRKGAPEIPTELIVWLQRAWLSLFMSVAAYVLVMSIMITRDYCFGERWRKKINRKTSYVKDSPGIFDVILWLLGVVAIICFLFGFGSLGWVACSLLTKV